MTDLPRLRPEPIPPIHPLPEYLAEGRVKERYEDMKAVFQVPWMGVVTMAYAHYPGFYDTLWTGLRPLCASRPFVEAFQDLRAFTEDAVEALNPPPICERLTELGYAPREIADICDMNAVISHGNFPYLIVASIARSLLEGGEMSGARAAPVFEGRHAPEAGVPFLLMEAHHADPPTRALYDDIETVLGLPFVNTDYRAFARWPSYFHRAWVDLKEVVGGAAYEDIVQGREGQYRVRLMDNKNTWDCAYPGVVILPDETIVTTTYGHWDEGEEPYIVSVRLKLEELDAKAPSR